MGTFITYAAGLALAAGIASGAAAQDQPVEILGGPAPAAGTGGPEWWAFSSSDSRHYLIDANSIQRTGNELTVMVARIPTSTAAGDYTHTVDQFGIRCRARQSRVVSSADAFETGELEEAIASDEDWSNIVAHSIDASIREISCEDMRPSPPSYPTVKAYIDAGRP